MTVATQRIIDGTAKALELIGNGFSVRKACDKAGISVTSLYHNSTAHERNAAFLKNSEVVISPDQQTPRGRRRRKVHQRQNMVPNGESTANDNYKQLMKELREKDEYIAKLEHKIVQTVVLGGLQ